MRSEANTAEDYRPMRSEATFENTAPERMAYRPMRSENTFENTAERMDYRPMRMRSENTFENTAELEGEFITIYFLIIRPRRPHGFSIREV